MNSSSDRLTQDISLWLAGESVAGAADRAVAGLAANHEARRTAGAALAVEDLVRDWYGGIPVPPPEHRVFSQRERRSLATASLAAVAVGLAVAAFLSGSGGPLDRFSAAAWNAASPRLPLAASSWWQLRRTIEGP